MYLWGEVNEEYQVSRPIFLSFDPFSLNFPGGRYPHSMEAELDLPLSSGSEVFTGSQLLRMNRQNGEWRADNSSVYDSILYPLAKARDRLWDILTTGRAAGEVKPWESPCPYVAYLLPVIVTAGPIYTVDAVTEEAKVAGARWARLRRDFRTRETSSQLVADLVSFQHLAEYIEARPLALMKRASEALTRKSHLYNPVWLLENLGRPARGAEFEQWCTYTASREEGGN